MGEDGIRKIQELSEQAGAVQMYEREEVSPHSKNVLIPSKAPGAVQGGLAALNAIPTKERVRAWHHTLVAVVVVVLGVVLILAGLLAYYASLGHYPKILQ